jgi:hypothetical protein
MIAAAVVSAVTATSLGMVTAASALTVETIQGHVRDAAGQPLAGVGVTDGNQAVYTDTSGFYSLSESSPGTYQVSLSRLGLDRTSRNVGPTDALQAVDFVMTYVLGVQLSSPALNSSRVSSQGITATTFAPSLSCVTWTDAISGTKVPLTYGSTNADSSNVFTGSFPVGGLGEGRYGSSTVAASCGTGAAVTQVKPATYVVDNTPPVVENISPFSETETVFTHQPIEALIKDSGSGVDPATLSMTLQDLTAGASSPISSGISWNPSTSIAIAPPQVLTVGHVYSVTAAVSDRAGNHAVASQGTDPATSGFEATSTSPTAASAAIPATTCSVGNIDTNTHSRPVTCQNVPLSIGAATVTMGPTRETGTAYVEQTVALNTAQVQTTIAGLNQSQAAYQPGDPAWQPKVNSVGFNVAAPSASSQTLNQSGTTVNLGTLQTQVPVTWTSATLIMAPLPSQPSIDSCADLTSTGTNALQCTTDPLADVYRVTFNSSVGNPTSAAAKQASTYGFSSYSVLNNPSQPGYDAALPYPTALRLASDSATAVVFPPNRNTSNCTPIGTGTMWTWAGCAIPSPIQQSGGCWSLHVTNNNNFWGTQSMTGDFNWCGDGTYVTSLPFDRCDGGGSWGWSYKGCDAANSPVGSPWANVDVFFHYHFSYDFYFRSYDVDHYLDERLDGSGHHNEYWS